MHCQVRRIGEVSRRRAGFGKDELSVRQMSKAGCEHVHVHMCLDSVAVGVRGTSVDYLAEEVRFGQGVEECLLS